MANGYYLTIGLNEVSDFYTASPLAGCINDARDISRIAESQGFKKPRNFANQQYAMLTDSAATFDRVLAEIRAAGQQMSAGDIFLLHYSGHGLENGTIDESGDVDTCWATYDKPLIDNELYAAWFSFPNNSRILVFSDSCHSGTMIRTINKRDLGGRENQMRTDSAAPARVRAAPGTRRGDQGVDQGQAPGRGRHASLRLQGRGAFQRRRRKRAVHSVPEGGLGEWCLPGRLSQVPR